ncbi:hypothetical protein [Aeoliella sp. SH292]|uniref:hypothetical protein n=1 Tax=Aeoliella sp. SH292 TaxID=3454464 RepID=UPI003F948DA5
MRSDSELFERVQQYARARNRIVVEQQKLGYGSDGTIWRTSDSAIKALHRRSNFDVELGSYQRLAAAGVDAIDGFAVPRLIDFDEDLMVIEMEIVQPPYVLDFGKVYLDQPPAYWNDPQIRNNAYAEWRERFDEHWEKVAGVMFSLERFGIYYVDPRPSNIDTTGIE